MLTDATIRCRSCLSQSDDRHIHTVIVCDESLRGSIARRQAASALMVSMDEAVAELPAISSHLCDAMIQPLWSIRKRSHHG